MKTKGNTTQKEISISFTDFFFDSNHNTFFRILVKSSFSQHELNERYSSMLSFHYNLKLVLNKKNPLPEFPSKKWFGNSGKEFLTERQNKLQQYFNKLLEMDEIHSCKAFNEFLKISYLENQVSTATKNSKILEDEEEQKLEFQTPSILPNEKETENTAIATQEENKESAVIHIPISKEDERKQLFFKKVSKITEDTNNKFIYNTDDPKKYNQTLENRKPFLLDFELKSSLLDSLSLPKGVPAVIDQNLPITQRNESNSFNSTSSFNSERSGSFDFKLIQSMDCLIKKLKSIDQSYTRVYKIPAGQSFKKCCLKNFPKSPIIKSEQEKNFFQQSGQISTKEISFNNQNFSLSPDNIAK